MRYEFGIGAMWGRPVAGNLATPSGPQAFGIIEDVSIDIDGKIVDLLGQNQFPIDTAASDKTVKGKATIADLDINLFNSLFFADTIVTGSKLMVDGEDHTIAGTTSVASPILATNHAKFLYDLGVRYSSSGVRFVRVTAGSEAQGKYSVNETTGSYTFDPSDLGAEVLISYAYSSVGGQTLQIKNHKQGYGPAFEMWLQQPYQNAGNGLWLARCKSAKFSLPMKRADYIKSDFEFQAYANPAGLVGEWYQQ